MTTRLVDTRLGHRALRNIAMVPDQLLASGQLLYGTEAGENIQLEMLKSVHRLPTVAPTTLTGIATYTPNISVFEPGDEDLGLFANAYDQTITSRSSDITFSTEGANFQDLREICSGLVEALDANDTPGTTANYGLDIPVIAGEYGAGGTSVGLNIGLSADAISNGTRRSYRQNLDVAPNKTQKFQLWQMLWEEGLDRMYAMPGAVLTSMQLNATLRQAIRMSAQFTGADIVDVQAQRHLALNETAGEGANVIGNYTSEIYPGVGSRAIFATTRASGLTGDNTDLGVSSWRNGNALESAVRELKDRFTAQTIEVFIDPDGGNSPFAVSSDLAGMQATINTGLLPSWRFGNLGFSTVVRGRRGIMFRLNFLNSALGRRQFQEFLRPQRRVQTIWVVLWNPARTHRMIIKANVRISQVGQLPGDDGQNANTTELTYMSVGIDKDENYLSGDESDFEIHFDEFPRNQAALGQNPGGAANPNLPTQTPEGDLGTAPNLVGYSYVASGSATGEDEVQFGSNVLTIIPEDPDSPGNTDLGWFRKNSEERNFIGKTIRIQETKTVLSARWLQSATTPTDLTGFGSQTTNKFTASAETPIYVAVPTNNLDESKQYILGGESPLQLANADKTSVGVVGTRTVFKIDNPTAGDYEVANPGGSIEGEVTLVRDQNLQSNAWSTAVTFRFSLRSTTVDLDVDFLDHDDKVTISFS